jgi:hypothetical protein
MFKRLNKMNAKTYYFLKVFFSSNTIKLLHTNKKTLRFMVTDI